LQRAIGWVDQGYFKRLLGVEVKRMFGALCFMFNGHMCCGIEKDHLMVRVMPDRYETLRSKPSARKMDLTGKPLKGFLFISEAGYRTASSAPNQSRRRKRKPKCSGSLRRKTAVDPNQLHRMSELPLTVIGFTSSKSGDMMDTHCSTIREVRI
jgi:hypothetical protein